MSTPIDTPADAALTELAERFERWRRARRNGHAFLKTSGIRQSL
jgi:hypothetical protein